MRIIAQYFPNNEVRVVFCQERPTAPFEYEDSDHSPSVPEVVSIGPCPAACPPLTLGLNSKPEVSALPPGYGGAPHPVAFGSNARRSLLRAGGALEKHGIPQEWLLFLTGTLPGSSEGAVAALQNWSSYAVNLLKAKLAKMGCRHTYSLYCWELQQRGALHIHYCLAVEDEGLRERVLAGWKKLWEQVLDAVGKRAGVDMWDRGNGGTWKEQKEVLQAPAQQVYKSVGSYLSKYLSKSSNPTYSKVFGDHRYLGPVRWWGVSRPLMELVRLYSDRVEIEAVSPWKVKRIRQEIELILRGMDAKVATYSDLAKSAEVFVSYSQENATYVYSQIAKLLTPRWCYRDPAIGRVSSGHNDESLISAPEVLGVQQESALPAFNERDGDGFFRHGENVCANSPARPAGLVGSNGWNQLALPLL